MSAPNLTKGNGLDGANIQPAKTHIKTYSVDSDIESRFRKALATLQAKFALLGLTLEVNRHADELEPTFWVGDWAQAHPFKSLTDVRKYFVQIGGVQ
jgi:hypothetical protein